MKVRNIMTADPVMVEPDTSIEEIATIMKMEDIGAVPVVEEGELCGIVTDRDIVLRCIATGQDPSECTAEEVMTQQIHSIGPDASADEAARIMADRQIRRLPIVEKGRLVGMLSLGDLAVKCRDDDLCGDTLEDVSKGVRQSQEGGTVQFGRESKGKIDTPSRGGRGSHGDRSEISDIQASTDAEPDEGETERLSRGHTGASRSGVRPDRMPYPKQEKQPATKRQPQGLKSDSSSRKQGITNRNAKEENERNDNVIPFRRENEIRNTRVQKPTPRGGKKSAS